MKVKYYEEHRLIEIDDNFGKNNWTLKFVLIINIINGGFNLVQSFLTGFNWFSVMWVSISLISIFILLFLIFKKTSESSIKIKDIDWFLQKEFFGRKSFKLKLKNGKVRDLLNLKKQSQVDELESLFRKAGISSKLTQHHKTKFS
ncbi:hypothetical protein [Gillisia sp. JM1]|uniref:hypothetical protein n=1 Tax=Gillisia sp. JM1 TaxID=1283286 RepID=UPI0003FA5163|nr:hypothetical protein [Gillisia sp. JM1]